MKSGPPIFCLVGAGVNPNLLTAVLTDDLLNWDEFRDPTGSADVYGAVWTGDDDTRTPFFRWLLSRIHLAFQDPANEANFEDLIHILELATSEGAAERIDPKWASFARPYGADLFQPTDLARELVRQNASYIADRACMFILRRVKERTANTRTLPAADLLKSLSDDGSRLRIFSLNYDSLIANALTTPLWTGYGDEVDGRAEFTFPASYPADADLYIQLHGSINFGAAQIRVGGPAVFPRFSSSDRAAETWQSVSGGGKAMDRSEYPNVPMITGRRKPDRILQEPFSSYYHFLRQTAFETPNWLVLGYGGGDVHVNAVLASAMEHWGDHLRAFVCNYLPPGMCDYDHPDLYTVEPGFDCSEIVFGRAGYATLFDVGDVGFFRRRWEMKTAPVYGRARLVRRFANKINGAVLLTVDGRYSDHLQEIQHWFARRKTTR